MKNEKKNIDNQRVTETGVNKTVDGLQSTELRQNITKLQELMKEKQFSEVKIECEKLTTVFPNIPLIWNIYGAAQSSLREYDKAELCYRQALKLKPNSYQVHSNLGNALANQLKHKKAKQSYLKALEINPKYLKAHINLAKCCVALRKFDSALGIYKKVLTIDPASKEAYNNMGNIYNQQGDNRNAIKHFQKAIEIDPNFVIALTNLAYAYQTSQKIQKAINFYERALSLKPDLWTARAQLIHQKQHICDFSVYEEIKKGYKTLGITTDAIPSFIGLSIDDSPKRQLLRALNWTAKTIIQKPQKQEVFERKITNKFRIGYFSADFHDHATMYLISGLLRTHTRREFEVYIYSYGKKKIGTGHQVAKQSADCFYDISNMSDDEIKNLTRSHDLEIAIDLKGHTAQTRLEVFQNRLAPIQISFLGYPGTLGANFIDYIIADDVVIPQNSTKYFSEKIIHLPNSYQPNDKTRLISNIKFNRKDFGLRSDAFVLCCFNSSYKISPREFEIWMRILSDYDHVQLWLLLSNKLAEENLRKEAFVRGIDPNRLIFARKTTPEKHLARQKLADLFIDTFNVNAHTTASDALWGDLPVVTKIGNQFAARVAASLLTALELPELITETEEEYEYIIRYYIENPMKLTEIRKKLEINKSTKALFDTDRYTLNFENGLKRAISLHRSGLPPEDIYVTEN